MRKQKKAPIDSGQMDAGFSSVVNCNSHETDRLNKYQVNNTKQVKGQSTVKTAKNLAKPSGKHGKTKSKNRITRLQELNTDRSGLVPVFCSEGCQVLTQGILSAQSIKKQDDMESEMNDIK